MTRLFAAMMLVLSLALPTLAANEARQETFELTPVAPPDPALKYQLLFPAAERTPGNAAVIYDDAALLMSQDKTDAADTAIDDIGKDPKEFDSLADKALASNQFVLDELDVAGRRDHCDWDPPMRERGFKALLPHLNYMRQMANLLRVAAVRQMEKGDIDGALRSLRLGYELGRKVGQEPVLVSNLVGIGIAAVMNDDITQLMQRPDSPNLYWALATLPRPMFSLRAAMDGEQQMLFDSVPELAKARTGDISADEWKQAIHKILAAEAAMAAGPQSPAVNEAAVMSQIMTVLPEAQDYYAKSRNVSPDDVAKLDPMKVIGTYFFEDYQRQSNEMHKALDLPYAQMIPKLDQADQELKAAIGADPSNPLLTVAPSVGKAGRAYARIARDIAALTAVEAIRAYAAVNNNQLPAHLSDITDTPVPDNPMTGQPFDYQSDGQEATLTDVQADVPLTYTIHIRK